MQTTRAYERVLSMAQMHEIGVLHRGPEMLWTCRWNEAGRVSTIHYRLERVPRDESLALRLRYRVLPEAGEPEATLDYAVPVRTSPSTKGGTWYWFVCPLSVDGLRCHRLARNLYFLPWSPYFGCRHCRDTLERSLPVAKRMVFRQTMAALPEEEAQQATGPAAEHPAGWRPSGGRTACRHCGCLSEGAYCCQCGRPMAGEHGTDYFELLGVAPQASSRDIRVAFTTRLKEYHPDRVAHLGPKLQEVAEEEIRQINLAYEVLKDPETRLDYLRRIGKA